MLRLAEIFRRRAAAPSNVGINDSRLPAPQSKMARPGWYWMQHPMVRDRINVLTSGDRHTDAYGRLAGFLGDCGHPGPLGRCASLGCGSGGLERDLVRRGMVGDIEGYDRSESAVAEARRLAADLGYGDIRYHTADLAGLVLPEAQFDAIFTHSSLQAVEALESVVATVRRALKPGGIFHLNEFVGPSRFQWIDAQVRLTNEFLDTLPDRLLETPAGRKPRVERPTVEHMLAVHPTKAVRSSEIREVLTRHFDILEERPFGGTLLHMGLSDIAQNFDGENPEDVAHLERFFDLEDQVLTNGTLSSDFTVLTAAPAPVSRRSGEGRGASARPVLFGMSPTRQLRLPPGFTCPSLNLPSLNLTVSKADTMLGGNDGHYLSVGQSALAAVGRTLDGAEPRNILDLPCGFGRVTRALRARFPHAAITVSDLDRPGVAFSAHEFDARAAYSVRDFRDLDLGEAYDLIWVGSLMTHLPAAQTKHLLSALRRHLSPGGTVLVTLQGPSIIPRLRETGYGLPRGGAEAVIEGYERTGFGYCDYQGGKDLYGVSLTNDNYGISLTDESWIGAALGECGLRLHAYEVQAWDDHHDIAIARSLERGALDQTPL